MSANCFSFWGTSSPYPLLDPTGEFRPWDPWDIAPDENSWQRYCFTLRATEAETIPRTYNIYIY